MKRSSIYSKIVSAHFDTNHSTITNCRYSINKGSFKMALFQKRKGSELAARNEIREKNDSIQFQSKFF